MGVQLFQERGKTLQPMSALAETEEQEDEPEDPENRKVPSGKDEPTPDAKETDPLAALGDKIAKHRYFNNQYIPDMIKASKKIKK